MIFAPHAQLDTLPPQREQSRSRGISEAEWGIVGHRALDATKADSCPLGAPQKALSALAHALPPPRGGA